MSVRAELSASELRDAVAAGSIKASDAMHASFDAAESVRAGRDGLNLLLWTDRGFRTVLNQTTSKSY